MIVAFLVGMPLKLCGAFHCVVSVWFSPLLAV